MSDRALFCFAVCLAMVPLGWGLNRLVTAPDLNSGIVTGCVAFVLIMFIKDHHHRLK
jgi:lipopolysaccharide export LptBFGC system permease protein LptF